MEPQETWTLADLSYYYQRYKHYLGPYLAAGKVTPAYDPIAANAYGNMVRLILRDGYGIETISVDNKFYFRHPVPNSRQMRHEGPHQHAYQTLLAGAEWVLAQHQPEDTDRWDQWAEQVLKESIDRDKDSP